VISVTGVVTLVRVVAGPGRSRGRRGV